MKMRFSQIIPAVCFSMAMSSCMKEQDNTYKGDPYVYFQDEEIVVFENSTSTLSIPILCLAGTNEGNVDLTFTFGGTAEEGLDYTLVSPATVSFGMGAKGELQIIPIDNTDETPREILITISSASNGAQIGFPGDEAYDAPRKTVKIILRDDENCTYYGSDFLGSWDVSAPDLGGDCPTTEVVTGGGYNFNLTNGLGFCGVAISFTTVPDDATGLGTILIPNQDLEEFGSIDADTYRYTAFGTGDFVICASAFSLDIGLIDNSDGSTLGPWTFNYSR